MLFERSKNGLLEEWNGELRDSKSRIPGVECSSLIPEMRRETPKVDLANKVMGNHYLSDVENRSALHRDQPDRIFDMNVRLDIKRCRSPRIHVVVRAPQRNTTNSNGNQPSEAFCMIQ